VKFIFVIVSSLSGLFIGVFSASFTISKADGLAGSATVLLYGLIGLILAIIISLFLIRKIERKLITKITIILAILNLLPIGWIVYRYVTVTSQTLQEEPKKLTPTEIQSSLISLFINTALQNNNSAEIGLGMATPDFYNNKVFYFYSAPDFQKAVNEYTPTDSIVFEQTEHHNISISYAPPWFFPEHLKLDYEILYLKVLAINHDWLHVELNKETGYSAWLPRKNVTLKLWPEFLLSVFSIEKLDNERNPLRVKPLKHASKIMIEKYEILTPVIIKANWLLVNLIDKDFHIIGEGWIEWQRDGKFIISYSLLS
jgi:hypothetical protein